jgi:acyl dehydratase
MLQTTRNYYLAVRGVARRQRLSLPTRPIAMETPFRLSDSSRHAWHTLFGVQAGHEPPPLSYYAQPTVDAFHRIIDELGLNFRNVLHLQWDLDVVARGAAALRPGDEYRVLIGLEDVSFLKRDRAVFVCNVDLTDASGQPVLHTAYSFLIKNLSPRDVSLLRQSSGYNRQHFPELKSISRPEQLVPAGVGKAYQLSFPEAMGVHYGRVSGDMNIVHVSKRLVRLFGYKRPFAQGMCTANFVLKTLSLDERRAIRHFNITFCRPVFLGDSAELTVDGNGFQLSDADRQVLAVGKWTEFDGAPDEPLQPPRTSGQRRLSRASTAVAMTLD